eukprot:CAMPEP_0204379644 /NCGR_PEP_ID=MMETSP0469-20131031/52759_1 /ASSEMBLY_ACC=CAM_ASM_000384 /TAXON_ID=2969 /ORGANISM="Oxyrrhis marina" /LENGTH=227 /DNA_ID=CAMNT_0051371157 /DNA_START=20 /DNA_END=703 /DNA_ORIENTATION=+
MTWRQNSGWADGFEAGTLDDSLHKRFDDYWRPMGILGVDRTGDLVLWERMGTGNIDMFVQIPDEFLRKHETYSITRMSQAIDEHMMRTGRAGSGSLTIVEDLQGLNSSQFHLGGFAKFGLCARIGEDYFPELVKKIVVVRAPWIFSAMWKIVQLFFDEGTRAKIDFVPDSRTYDAISALIEPQWIPEILGGELRACGRSDCFPVIAKPPREVDEQLIADIKASMKSH